MTELEMFKQRAMKAESGLSQIKLLYEFDKKEFPKDLAKHLYGIACKYYTECLYIITDYEEEHPDNET